MKFLNISMLASVSLALSVTVACGGGGGLQVLDQNAYKSKKEKYGKSSDGSFQRAEDGKLVGSDDVAYNSDSEGEIVVEPTQISGAPEPLKKNDKFSLVCDWDKGSVNLALADEPVPQAPMQKDTSTQGEAGTQGSDPKGSENLPAQTEQKPTGGSPSVPDTSSQGGTNPQNPAPSQNTGNQNGSTSGGGGYSRPKPKKEEVVKIAKKDDDVWIGSVGQISSQDGSKVILINDENKQYVTGGCNVLDQNNKRVRNRGYAIGAYSIKEHDLAKMYFNLDKYDQQQSSGYDFSFSTRKGYLKFLKLDAQVKDQFGNQAKVANPYRFD